MSQDLQHTLKLSIPLESSKQTDILIQSMSPDPVLNPGQFSVEYTTVNSKNNNTYGVDITFKSIDERVMRVGVNNTIEALKSIIETFDEFDNNL
ncbi:hypothetical protein ACO0RG_000075 [Hanseniaspora osmophila]|uniref:EKC/KEOPS complex subunit PCC1 n=1 Tax=Hanseniaspora osmophila TaxID=56408 RepID=A0A1E5R4R7_9ASCO|nr:EKC/KEOPS complex subunit PCC1 [Hanseniaspora osmophila]